MGRAPTLWFTGLKGCDPELNHLPWDSVVSTVEELRSRPGNAVLVMPSPGQPASQYFDNVNAILDFVLAWKRQNPATPLLVVIDEAQEYSTKLSYKYQAVDAVINTSRALNVSVIMTNPNLQSVSINIFSQCTYFVMFSDVPGQREWYEKHTGSQFRAEDLMHLHKKWHGLMFDKDGMDLYYVYPDGSFEMVRDLEKELMKDVDVDEESETGEEDDDEGEQDGEPEEEERGAGSDELDDGGAGGAGVRGEVSHSEVNGRLQEGKGENRRDPHVGRGRLIL